MLVASAIRLNPVIKLAAAGLTPMSPTMAVVPLVEIPVFAKATKLPLDLKPSRTRPTAVETVNVVEPDFPFALAVMRVNPFDKAEAKPELETTVATWGIDDVQTTVAVKLAELPSE